MSLSQRIIDLATRIAGEIKLKPSKSANEVITGKWDMAQQGVQVVTNLSAPNSGYVGFAAKADGLYQKIGTGADLRLLTATDAALYLPLTGGVLSGTLSVTRLISTIATGTAPLSVTSTTIVSNLNVDMLDGNHASAFALAASKLVLSVVVKDASDPEVLPENIDFVVLNSVATLVVKSDIR